MMNSEMKDFVSFLGYGEPKNSIWFIGTEENASICNKEEWLSQLQIVKDAHELESINFQGEKFTLKHQSGIPFSDKGNVYRSCAKLLQEMYSISYEEALMMLGNKGNLFCNLLPIPNIYRSNKDWTIVEEFAGMTIEQYFKEIISLRIEIFAQCMARYTPKAVIIFCEYWEKLSEALFAIGKEKYRNSDSPFFVGGLRHFPSIIVANHPSARNGIHSEKWADQIVKRLR